jgi:hypothetical protein
MSKSKVVKKGKTLPVASPKAIAIHAEHEDGVHHVVGLGNIRVLLLPDGDGWFAQGLEIDYGAQGDTIEDAKTQFEHGLEATVEEHLRVNGNIDMLLKVAPDDIWNLATKHGVHLKRYTQVTNHHVIRENTNYQGIAYLVAGAAA